PYSFTSGGWTAIGDAELKMGTQIGDAGQAYDLSDAAGARYIGLKLTSNHGGGEPDLPRLPLAML
ncbi:hypothetical protein N9081_05750, partial [Akkermansiaceae bacterium]|nr:hypothetical protein [Akkermansiaceae bacterium]